MATIRTPCPKCDREVDVASDDILLLFRGDDDEEGTYAFVCPECEELQDKPAPRRLAMVLIAANVPWESKEEGR